MAGTATVARRAPVKTLQALENLEIKSASDLALYAESVNAMASRLALELSTTATVIRRELIRSLKSQRPDRRRDPHVNPMDVFQGRVAARRTVAPLDKAAESARDCGAAALKMWRAYTVHWSGRMSQQATVRRPGLNGGRPTVVTRVRDRSTFNHAG